MLGHAIVLIAIHVILEAIKTSSALQIIDLSNFIQSLQGNEEIYDNARYDETSKTGDQDYVSISSRELDELIDQVANNVYYQNRNTYNDLTRNLKGSMKYEQGDLQSRLSNLAENSIHNGWSFKDDDDSKVYLVLNQRANINDNDFKDITGLLSQIQSGMSSKKDYSKQDDTRMKKQLRYKGFVIADGSSTRRRNRESKELYSQLNSMEDYKPKRVRNDYGGAGGRTPIPYIRHRDIYERE